MVKKRNTEATDVLKVAKRRPRGQGDWPCVYGDCKMRCTRAADVKRHLYCHFSNVSKKYFCAFEGCTFITDQRKKFEAHTCDMSSPGQVAKSSSSQSKAQTWKDPPELQVYFKKVNDMVELRKSQQPAPKQREPKQGAPKQYAPKQRVPRHTSVSSAAASASSQDKFPTPESEVPVTLAIEEKTATQLPDSTPYADCHSSKDVYEQWDYNWVSKRASPRYEPYVSQLSGALSHRRAAMWNRDESYRQQARRTGGRHDVCLWERR